MVNPQMVKGNIILIIMGALRKTKARVRIFAKKPARFPPPLPKVSG